MSNGESKSIPDGDSVCDRVRIVEREVVEVGGDMV